MSCLPENSHSAQPLAEHWIPKTVLLHHGLRKRESSRSVLSDCPLPAAPLTVWLFPNFLGPCALREAPQLMGQELGCCEQPLTRASYVAFWPR